MYIKEYIGPLEVSPWPEIRSLFFVSQIYLVNTIIQNI